MGNLCDVQRSVRPSSILGKQKHTLAHFGTCNNTCCAISVSVFTAAADEGVGAAAAADTAAAADPDDSGTVGGIVPMG